MRLSVFKTHRIASGESLEGVLKEYLPPLLEKDVIVITAKAVSYAEKRLVPRANALKEDLVHSEADRVFYNPNAEHPRLTLKDGILCPAAGIDDSNAGDNYILLPQDSMQTAANLWRFLKATYALQKVGVVIVDSKSQPLRRGVVGIALGWAGLEPLYSYNDTKDLDQRPFEHTQTNVVDSVAAAAVLMMGEGAEQTPFARVQDIPRVTFLDVPTNPLQESLVIAREDDLSLPVLQHKGVRCA